MPFILLLSFSMLYNFSYLVLDNCTMYHVVSNRVMRLFDLTILRQINSCIDCSPNWQRLQNAGDLDFRKPFSNVAHTGAEIEKAIKTGLAEYNIGQYDTSLTPPLDTVNLYIMFSMHYWTWNYLELLVRF